MIELIMVVGIAYVAVIGIAVAASREWYPEEARIKDLCRKHHSSAIRNR